MKKELKFLFPAVINCYSGDAGRVAVQSNYNSQLPLIIVNHLTLAFDYRIGVCGFNWNYYNNSGFCDIDIREELEKHDIVEYIIQSINEDYHIQMWLDHYYISQTSAYHKYHFIHDNASIYGYDFEKKVFFVADNFINGKYLILEVPFDEIREARNNIKDKQAFKYKIKDDYNKSFFSLKNIIMIFEGFLEGKYLLSDDSNWDDNIVYGIKVYDILIGILVERDIEKIEYNIRSFHAIYNQKSIIIMLIEYIKDLGGLSDSKSLIEDFEGLKKDWLIIRNCLIKYQITKDDNIIDMMIMGIQNTKNKEVLVVNALIHQLNMMKDIQMIYKSHTKEYPILL